MPPLTEDALAAFPEPAPADVVPQFVARDRDLVALARQAPATVIGAAGHLRDRPGFEMTFVAAPAPAPRRHDRATVLMPVRGHWRLTRDGGSDTLGPGDTGLVPAGLAHAAVPSMAGEAALYRVIGTGDPPGPTRALFGEAAGRA